MNIFEYIAKHQGNSLKEWPEYTYYKRNKGLLKEVPHLLRGIDPRTRFGILRANILIKSIVNKLLLEEGRSASDLISIQEGERKVYLPILPYYLEDLYLNHRERLEEEPYRRLSNGYWDDLSIDPFDRFGVEIFDSAFCHLSKVASTKEGAAFYDEVSECVYFVNSQRRLDVMIALFDRHLEGKKPEDINEAVNKLVEAYYEGDLKKLSHVLWEYNFLSEGLLKKMDAELAKGHKTLKIS